MDKKQSNTFSQRVDFYGQALAAYVVVLVVFFIFKGSVIEGSITVRLFSPIIILMLTIIVLTTIMLIIATIKRKRITIDDDSITFHSRYYNKTYKFDQIKHIHINKSPTKVVKHSAHFVKLKIKGKKKSILVRTASFNNDNELLDRFIEMRKQLIDTK
ncbi:MAG: hypothetical protein LBO69_08620 [Ignavibacteria bacterium]|jgi:hypothetical protein|nr:hypothetical protein [Ignavibacteria bacterium]